MKHIRQIITLLLLCIFTALQAQQKAFTVVIDAGHGGKDPGALGKSMHEKDLNLGVAIELGNLIESRNKDVKVIYTRKTDVFLPLQDRADIVNKNKADLFICIHTNSADAKSVAGAEVFTLGLHKAESNLDVAMRENSVMLLEDGYQARYQGFNPNSVESYIMFEFMQDQYIDKSVNYAYKAQKELCNTAGRIDRGVRQAGFWVLHKSSCPSVLVEMGFITNPNEYTFLASKEGQQKIALALYNAFADYKREIDKKSGKPEQEQISKTEQKTETKKIEQKPGQQKVTTQEAEQKPEQQKENTQVAEQKQEQQKENTQVAEQKQEQQNTEQKPIVPQPEQKQTESPNDENAEEVLSLDPEKPIYKVQCFAVTEVIKPNDPTLKSVSDIDYYKENGWYKYTVGASNNFQDMVELQKQLKDKFKGCFIIAFYKGEKIKVEDAKKLSGK